MSEPGQDHMEDIMKEKQECEHELDLTDLHWMSDNTVMVTATCDKCKQQFRGMLIKND